MTIADDYLHCPSPTLNVAVTHEGTVNGQLAVVQLNCLQLLCEPASCTWVLVQENEYIVILLVGANIWRNILYRLHHHLP